MKYQKFIEQLAASMDSAVDKATANAAAATLPTGAAAGAATLQEMFKSLNDRIDTLHAALKPAEADGTGAGPVFAALTEVNAEKAQIVDVLEKALDRLEIVEKGGVRPKSAAGDAGKPVAGAAVAPTPNDFAVQLAKAMNLQPIEKADESWDSAFRYMHSNPGRPVHIK